MGRSRLQNWTARVLLIKIAGIVAVGMGSSYYGWPHLIELLSHFQGQYLILCLVLLGGLVLTRRWIPIGIGILLTLLLSIQIMPWYLSPPLQALMQPLDNPVDLRVLFANVNTKNPSPNQVIRLIQQERPDILLLMEVSETWLTPLSVLEDQLPYSFYRTGNFLLSRYPLQDPYADTFGTTGTATLFAQISPQDQPITLVGSHPWPPLRPNLFHSRNRHLDGIAQTLQSISTPVILMGDINITPWSPYYRRLITVTGLSNTRLGFGILPSWPTAGTFPLGLSAILQLPIDHCLVSPEFETLDIQIGPEIGSDHWPVIVDLALRSRDNTGSINSFEKSASLEFTDRILSQPVI